MTIALSATATPAPALSGQGRTVAQPGDGRAFGGLLEATLSPSPHGEADPLRALRAAIGAAPVTPGTSATMDAPGEGGTDTLDALTALLEDLQDDLAVLEDSLENDAAPNPDLLGVIDGLVSRIRGLLEPGDAGALSGAIAALSPDQRQGFADLLDTVAGLANRASDSLGEGPIAETLDRFARLLDRQAAAIPAADPTTSPAMLEKLARAETSASLDGATSPAPGKEERPGGVKPDRPATGATTAADRQPNAVNRPEGAPIAAPDLSALKAALSPEAASVENRPEKALDALVGTTTAPSTPATQLAAAPAPAAYARPDAPINLPYIATEIARQVQNGVSRFEIRLNPPEMGRIDVRLEFDPSGNVTARLAVERAETLDLLQRDQRALERALTQAGLDSGKTNLEFSLRQGSPDGRGQFENPFGDDPAGQARDGQDESEPATPPATIYRGHVRADAVNLWI